MTPDLLSSFSLSTPELILAIGALALLMVGAYSRSNTTMTVTGLAGQSPSPLPATGSN